MAEDAPQLPRIASPVYLGSNVGNTNTRVGPHRVSCNPVPVLTQRLEVRADLSASDPASFQRSQACRSRVPKSLRGIFYFYLKLLFEINYSKVPLDRMFKCAELPSRRSVEIYAWSIGTAELYTRRESSISSPSSEWQLAELPTDLKPQEHDLTMWWDKFKVLIKNRMKGLKEYGAFC